MGSNTSSITHSLTPMDGLMQRRRDGKELTPTDGLMQRRQDGKELTPTDGLMQRCQDGKELRATASPCENFSRRIV